MRADPGHVITHHVNIALVLGSINAAILWDQLLFLSTPSRAPTNKGFHQCKRDADGWFIAPLDFVAGHCGFGETQMRNARKDLEKAGVVTTRVKGVPPKLQWRLDQEALDDLLRALAAEPIPSFHQNQSWRNDDPVAVETPESSFLQDSVQTGERSRPETTPVVAEPKPAIPLRRGARHATRQDFEMAVWRDTPEELLAVPLRLLSGHLGIDRPIRDLETFGTYLADRFIAYDNRHGRPSVAIKLSARWEALEKRFYNYGPRSAYASILEWLSDGYHRVRDDWARGGGVDPAALNGHPKPAAPLPSTGIKYRPVEPTDV